MTPVSMTLSDLEARFQGHCIIQVYSTSNNSQVVQDRAIVTMAD